MNFLLIALCYSKPSIKIRIRQVVHQSSRYCYSIEEHIFKRVTVIPQKNLLAIRRNCTNSPDSDTNVGKDVILFKYENPKFYKVLNTLSISHFIFFSYLCYYTLTSLKDAPDYYSKGDNLVWYERINLGEDKYRHGISVCCGLIGYGILFVSWMFTLRSVRYLVLRKGGKDVSFVTYTPFGTNRIMTVPLKMVSAEVARETAKSKLPLKIRSRAFYYILDMRGEFKNPKLFDYTVGLKRN